MKFVLQNGTTFELTDKARSEVDADFGRALLDQAEQLYRAGGDTKKADAKLLVVMARALEMRDLATRAVAQAEQMIAEVNRVNPRAPGLGN